MCPALASAIQIPKIGSNIADMTIWWKLSSFNSNEMIGNNFSGKIFKHIIIVNKHINSFKHQQTLLAHNQIDHELHDVPGITRWCFTRPMYDRNATLGLSAPAKPAFKTPVPLSITIGWFIVQSLLKNSALPSKCRSNSFKVEWTPDTVFTKLYLMQE